MKLCTKIKLRLWILNVMNWNMKSTGVRCNCERYSFFRYLAFRAFSPRSAVLFPHFHANSRISHNIFTKIHGISVIFVWFYLTWKQCHFNRNFWEFLQKIQSLPAATIKTNPRKILDRLVIDTFQIVHRVDFLKQEQTLWPIKKLRFYHILYPFLPHFPILGRI